MPANAPIGSPESPDHAPVWLAHAIEWACAHRATDLHLFPGDGEGRLWARIDGRLHEIARYGAAEHERMVARLKVLGRCSDYDGQLVQEGRFSLNGSSNHGEARLSVIQTIRGEKAVIRLLSGGADLIAADALGFHDALLTCLRDAVDRPQGLVLAIGPSGCGKSTALYALLDDLARREESPLSIVTVEDPVEQSLPCAAQISADRARGLGFGDALRAILRQDPEVIMIGEIRDAETAATALQAALTGHRLLSSIHTLTPAEALVRLCQMGVPPYVVASAVAGVLNVRLVSLLCEECRRESPLTPEERQRWPEIGDTASQAAGCDTCLGSGYNGRTGIGEWVMPGPDTADALRSHDTSRAVAATLRTGVSARPAAAALLGEGRASLQALERLSGLVSLPREEARYA